MAKGNAYLHLFRKNTIIALTLSSYIVSVYYLFFDAKILWWLLFSILFFVFAHYFVIELRSSQETNMFFVIFIACIFLLILKWFWNIFYAFWIVLFNLAVFFLFWDIWNETYNRIQIGIYKIFTMWVWTYTLFLSSTFALSFLWTYRTFDLTCSQIYNQMSNFSQYAMSHLWFSSDQKTDKNKQAIVNILNPNHIKNASLKDVAEYIWWPSTAWTSGLDTKKTVLSTSWVYLSWLNLSWSIWNVSNSVKNWNIDFKWIDKMTFWILIDIKFRKWIIFNQIMENKQLLNENMCEIVVKNIKSKYELPSFQITVLFLMFMLFYPFIRIFLTILAILNAIAFWLMSLVRIYKFETVSEDVETIR